LLRLRRLWAHIGLHLKQPHLLSLTVGLERREGILLRSKPAVVAAKARVQKAISRAAARAALP
jgi:hypothetical protein